MLPVERASLSNVNPAEAMATTLPQPNVPTSAVPVVDGRTSITAWPFVNGPSAPAGLMQLNRSSPAKCQRCTAMHTAFRDHLKQLEQPSNMAESLDKMGGLSDMVRNINKHCEDCQKIQNESSANGTGRHVPQHPQTNIATFEGEENGSKGKKRKEPMDASHPGDRLTHKQARLQSGSPAPSRAASPLPPAREAPEITDARNLRPSNDAKIPAHLVPHVGPHTAEILNLPGAPQQRPHVRPRDDWSNMWSDAEYEKKRKEKDRKDSVPVLTPAGEAVEVLPR